MKQLISARLIVGAIGILGIVLVAAGCGSSSGPSTGSSSGGGESAGAGEKPEAAALVYTINDFTSAEFEAIKKELEKAGGSLQMLSANFNPQEQAAQCEDAITSQRYNIFFIDAVDSPSAAPCAVQAAEAGIKVIAMENPIGPSRSEVDPQIPQVQGSVISSPLEDAEHTFELVEQACKGISHCKWIPEIGNQTSPLDSTKIKRMEELVEETPNIEILQVIEGNYDPSETAKKVPDALSANPDTEVMSFESDTNALAAIPAVEAAGLEEQVKIIGDGGSRAGVKAIENGTMFGSVADYARTGGEVAAKMGLEALEGKTNPKGVSELSLKEPVTLTKANIGEYEAQWGAE